MTTLRSPQIRPGAFSIGAAALSAVALVLLVTFAPPARALFHFAAIDELMTGLGGSDAVQFVEIRMISGGQNARQVPARARPIRPLS